MRADALENVVMSWRSLQWFWLILAPACAGGGFSPSLGADAALRSDGGKTSAPEDANGLSGLHLAGNGFLSHRGNLLQVTVTDVQSGRRALDNAAIAIGDDGSFTLADAAALTPGLTYEVAYYVDVNRNGFCNVPPLDHTWKARFVALLGKTELALTESSDYVPACDAFGTYSIAFDSNYGLSLHGHPGNNVYGLVVDLADGSQVGDIRYDTVSTAPPGQATFAWQTLLVPDHRYVFAICIDDNANHLCDAATGVDHQFFHVENGEGGAGIRNDLSETFVAHVETNRSIAAYWPSPTLALPPPVTRIPTLIATGGTSVTSPEGGAEVSTYDTAVFDGNDALYEHNNHMSYWTVVDVTDKSAMRTVAEAQSALIVKGQVYLEWPHVLQAGHSYAIAGYSEEKAPEGCQGAPSGGDPQWFIPLPYQTGTATAYFAHQGRAASCAYFAP